MGCAPYEKNKKREKVELSSSTTKNITCKDDLNDSKASELDDYITIQLLGFSKTSEVLLSLYRPKNEFRAFKIIKKQNTNYFSTSEIILSQKLDHPNILKNYELLEDKYAYYIASYYCEGGALSKKLKTTSFFSETDISKIMTQLLSAVEYCHEKKVIHRDIKLENILLDHAEDLNIKLGDFGLAYDMSSKLSSDFCGTPSYMAPEIGKGLYDEKIDIWSCGVVLFILVTKRFPYKCKKVNEKSRPDFTSFHIEREEFPERSKELADFVRNLLTVDPKARPSAKEALESPWIKNKKLVISQESRELENNL